MMKPFYCKRKKKQKKHRIRFHNFILLHKQTEKSFKLKFTKREEEEDGEEVKKECQIWHCFLFYTIFFSVHFRASSLSHSSSREYNFLSFFIWFPEFVLFCTPQKFSYSNHHSTEIYLKQNKDRENEEENTEIFNRIYDRRLHTAFPTKLKKIKSFKRETPEQKIHFIQNTRSHFTLSHLRP